MDSLTISLIIIFIFITFIPKISRIIKIPVIVIEIIFGIIIGKSFLNIVPTSETILFFSSFGLTYLMFLAGLEMNIMNSKKHLKNSLLISLFSIMIPFISGYFIAGYFEVNKLLMGTILSTTSLGIILPISRNLKYKENFKNILLTSVVLVDIASMFILSFVLTFATGKLNSNYFISIIVISVLFLIPFILNKRNTEKIEKWLSKKSNFEKEVRFSFALIFVLTAISEGFGFHSIIGAFIAGLIITEITPKVSLLQDKLKSFGYGFFIPLFFIFTGTEVDLPVLFSNLDKIEFLLIIVFVGILSKVIGVTVIYRLQKNTLRESIAMGFFHSARLSLIVASVEIARRANLINEGLFSMLIIFALISAIIGPSVGKNILLAKSSQ